MPPIEKMYRRQYAVLWPRTGTDRYGEALIGSPQEIKVRWESKREESIKPDGEPIGIDAEVVVNIPIPDGSLMWEGRLRDWNPDATTNEIMVVIYYKKTPNVNASQVRRVVGLMKYGNTLPTPSAQAASNVKQETDTNGGILPSRQRTKTKKKRPKEGRR